jgi:hypothetical protein
VPDCDPTQINPERCKNLTSFICRSAAAASPYRPDASPYRWETTLASAAYSRAIRNEREGHIFDALIRAGLMQKARHVPGPFVLDNCSRA